MIKKLWARFDGMDLDCVCDEHHKKCNADSGCKEYVVKFIEVDRDLGDDFDAHLSQETRRLKNDIRKFQSELTRNLRKLKI